MCRKVSWPDIHLGYTGAKRMYPSPPGSANDGNEHNVPDETNNHGRYNNVEQLRRDLLLSSYAD